VGGDAAGWSGMWVLAVTVMILVAIRQTMSDCWGATAEDSQYSGVMKRVTSGLMTLSGGGRVLLVAVAASVWGARAALFGLLVWAIIVVGYSIGGYRPDEPASVESTAVTGEQAGEEYAAADQTGPTGLAALLELAAPVPAELTASPGPPGPARLSGLSGLAGYAGSKDAPRSRQALGNVRLLPGPAAQPVEQAPRNMTLPRDLTEAVGLAELGDLTGPLEITGPLDMTGLDLGWPVPVSAPDARLLAMTTACRDDGTFARYLGRLVRGQLIPLPPALAGLVAASMLAILGLRNLPGMIVLTPLVVMLLAAPGSSHPHDGRFDWLVPAVLQAGQYVYIATLGFASGVAPPVVFALCAVTAVRYADLAYRGRNAQLAVAGTSLASAGRRARGMDIGMGWEGRMLVVGLGAIAGIGTFAYLALTAYLGVLICSEVMTSCLAIGEDNRP
jgi:hypothetical protein